MENIEICDGMRVSESSLLKDRELNRSNNLSSFCEEDDSILRVFPSIIEVQECDKINMGNHNADELLISDCDNLSMFEKSIKS